MIAGVSVVCAVGPWLFTDAVLLRALAAGAAVTTGVGTFVMRRWDVAAGKRVADLTRARASDEWRHEERVAELETDLEESRELRQKLEHKLRAKRTELARLRNEHAALLRRYATAETERASALEGRRLLEIEAAPELSEPAETAAAGDTDAPVREAAASAEDATRTEAAGAAGMPDAEAPKAFSPSGDTLFRLANSALERLARAGAGEKTTEGTEVPEAPEDAVPDASAETAETEAVTEAASGASAEDTEPSRDAGVTAQAAGSAEAARGDAPVERATDADAPEDPPTPPTPPARAPRQRSAEDAAAATEAAEAPAQDTAAHGPTDSAAPAPAAAAPLTRPTGPGHFTVPTAVAVVPTEAPRRPSVQGGFDFFGTQKTAPERTADSVQNEDLADVVGQEALALHKAEAESGFKPAGPEVRAGQVIDLTAHDETEQIDIEGLRTAAS